MKENIQLFLSLPFTKQPYTVVEGWYYSEQEKSIHGFLRHSGIDFQLSRNTPVLASADGWAISSYFGYPLIKDNKPVLYKDKQVGFGLGYFVQIYHPEAEIFTAYGHLSEVAPEIKFHKPRKLGNHFWPVGHKISPEKLPDYKWVTKVKTGQVIGYVGDSGLTWGYQDYPQRPNPQKHPSWDDVHLHFEVFTRVGSKLRKKYLDPYGVKGVAEDYSDSFKEGNKLGKEGSVLWILGGDNLPNFCASTPGVAG